MGAYRTKYKRRHSKTKKHQPKIDKLREGFKRWTSFYRANPHRFATEYLGLNLHVFQKMMLYMMFQVNLWELIAARGLGKSFLVAIFSVIRCILYPGTMIVISSGTKGQAKLIVTQKIEKELMQLPNVAREIKEIRTSNNDVRVVFHNGSTIEAVTSSDNSRGYRAHILILDEYRLVKKDIYDKVLRPFLNIQRRPPYTYKPEYTHMIEENKELFISSAWYKSDWIWSHFKSTFKTMLKGKEAFVASFPYQLSVHHGLLSKKRVELMKSEENFDPVTWSMEMESLFYGESEKAFFNLNDLQKNREIVSPFYPLTNLEYLENKNKKTKQRNKVKQEGEIRLVSVDIAMMGGQQNDATIFQCVRLLPSSDGYIRHVSYIESMTGQHAETQAIRLKQLFEDFQADYVVMDTLGNGIAIYDSCTKVLYDEERDVEYPAWVAFNDEEMKNRALDKNALPVIYSIKVTKAEVNHEMAMWLRSDFEKGKIKLLVDEITARDYLTEKKNFNNLSPSEKTRLITPFIQTTSLINEMVNLEYKMQNGFVKVFETASNRKDRYSALAYCNYYARILEHELLAGQQEFDEDDELVYF